MYDSSKRTASILAKKLKIEVPQELKDKYPQSYFIPLTKGMFSVVDYEDYVEFIKRNWTTKESGGKKFYAVFRNGKDILKMHRLITNCPDGKMVDHINGDTLDNRRSNLRVCSSHENQCNQKLNSRNASGYRGVFWDNGRGKWCAKINCKGKQITAGYFESKENAATAFNFLSAKYHGEFGTYNKTA